MTLDKDAELDVLRTLLADAEARAEEADAVKRTFLLKMSHELLTPLNAIIGYSEMLIEEAHDLGEDGELFVTDLEKIGTSGRNLLSLVGGVLDMSKIESGDTEVHFEEVDLGELLADVGRAADSRGAQVVGAVLAIRSDARARLEQLQED